RAPTDANGVAAGGCVAKWGRVGYCGDRVEAQDRGGEAPPTSSLRSILFLTFAPVAERTREVAFRGLYEHSLDSKDRLTVPSRFRASLADGIVLSKGFDPCVWAHTTGEFEQLSDRFLSPHSPFGRDARALRRRFHGGSFDEKLDSAGRIRIPKPLIDHAG